MKSSTPGKPAKSSNISKVRVILRVRPFLPHEITSNNEHLLPCVSILANDYGFNSTHYEVCVHIKDQQTSREELYKLDGFYEQEEYNIARIFENEVKPLIPGIFHGCNATVFAYGATGSGKTYTMQGTDVYQGLIPLAMSAVLSMCQATGSIAEISYYEVYLDRCYDILELKAKEISVLDDKDGHVHLKGLSRVLVTSMSEFHDVFTRGIQRRRVAHTGLNDVSSRSHGVLVITVSKSSERGPEASITGKLNLIDLAGNEDNRKSGNDGIRLQESAKINQSLFALSNVIYALNNKKPWVPYRETKLTRILQDSLGGTSRALMIACLNPSDYQEAVYTVSLAARSRYVSNVVSSAKKQETPKEKIDMEAKLRVWLESKGKIQNTQRKDAFGSPFFIKSPGYNKSVKKQSVSCGSVNTKAANQGGAGKHSIMSMPQRKLFDTGASSDSSKDDKICTQDFKGLKHSSLSTTNQTMITFKEMHLNSTTVSQDFEFSHSSLSEEFVDKHSMKQPTANLAKYESTTRLPDELVEADKTENYKAENIIRSPLNRLKIMSCQSPLRKALSPMDSNKNRIAIEEFSSRDIVHSLLIGSSTPETPFVVTREKCREFDTPLDKFNAHSSNLKNFLAQEYIDFLNNATREELVELKGIGAKRAEYIMELRESSPLKSLSDLEKIGLSSKQVQLMFSKVAKNIFV